MRDHLRAGAAIYNAGEYHAAHDAWEDRWLDLEAGTDDERLLHGLIQFTAAVHHATHRNWEGAVGLAGSGGEYLADLPGEYRDVDVATVRTYLATMADDPEVIERRRPPVLRHEGVAPALSDLGPGTTAIAATVLAEEWDGYDEDVVERAAATVRQGDSEDGDVLALLFDFVRDPDARAIAYDRLRGAVERQRRRERDVDGLFDGTGADEREG